MKEVKNSENKKRYISRDCLSLLFSVLALITMLLVFGYVKVGYQFMNIQRKVYDLLFLDGLKIYSQFENDTNAIGNTRQVFRKQWNKDLR